MQLSLKKEKSLVEYVKRVLQDEPFFEFHQWDGLIEDGLITHEEIEFMDDNYTVEIVLKKKYE